jgi:hypothetical protein
MSGWAEGRGQRLHQQKAPHIQYHHNLTLAWPGCQWGLVLALNLRSPMVRLFTAAVLLLGIMLGPLQASACEKHINGHQNSSDTQGEAVQK